MASRAPTRSRLDPDIFRLPVERIRDGYYTDAYFNFSRQLLNETGHRPAVTVQVFQKQHSVLGGAQLVLGHHVDDQLLAGRRLHRGFPWHQRSPSRVVNRRGSLGDAAGTTTRCPPLHTLNFRPTPTPSSWTSTTPP